MKKKPSMEGPFDGVTAAAEMLNQLDPDDRRRILAELIIKDPKLAARIDERMFTFEDLLELEPTSLQTLVKDVHINRLALALRHASEPLKEAIMGAFPKRARDEVEEKIQALGPRRITDIQTAQKEIALHAKQMISDGKIKTKS
jgi:flagellar motor switch protein FliG